LLATLAAITARLQHLPFIPWGRGRTISGLIRKQKATKKVGGNAKITVKIMAKQ
jgi:hypothetical protein